MRCVSGRFDEFCSGYRSQKPEDDPTGSYPTLLSHSPGISMAATIFHRDQGRLIGLSQCQLLVPAGANRSRVRICYRIKSRQSQAWLLTAVLLVKVQVVEKVIF